MLKQLFLTIAFFANLAVLTTAVTDCTAYAKEPDYCLGTEECSYCIAKTYTGGSRCNPLRELVRGGCPRSKILNYVETSVEVKPPIIDNGTSTELPPPVILPLIPGTTRNLTITFELADHPVDVYYLMDFSGSMYDDKDNVVALSGKLADAVNKMSSDSTLGFGTFVDKPYGSLGSSYSRDYSYRNDRPLSTDKSGIDTLVAGIPILSGGDGPESQADAMFESMVCTTEVGWRSHARHLMILATDAQFHKAGDGLAQGIPNPFDGKCHLNSSAYYSEEINLDYPSVDQLVNAFEEHQVTPIFAVSEDYVRPDYQALADRLKAAAVGVLERDSSNVVDLILGEYEKIDSRFELESTEVTHEIHVKYFTDCKGTGGDVTESTICDSMGADRRVTVTMEIELDKCPTDPADWDQTMTINPVGLPTSLDIKFALICA